MGRADRLPAHTFSLSQDELTDHEGFPRGRSL
jgi:hypothetical protein